MTIPSRPAPPPPVVNNYNSNRTQTTTTLSTLSTSSSSTSSSTTTTTSRYTPTTNWDDKPFDDNINNQYQQNDNNYKKVPPPRPPPPKTINSHQQQISDTIYPALKKPGSQHSVNILSNLFGAKTRSKTPPNKLIGNNNNNNTFAQTNNNGRTFRNNHLPPKLPPPPGSISSTPSSSSGFSSIITSPNGELIDFHSPPSSPTLTQKSNSDCVSIDSFSSESNYSPQNGNTSQTESGFEDDFNIDTQTSINNKDPWELAAITSTQQQQHQDNKRTFKPPIAQKPVIVGRTSFYAYHSNILKKPQQQQQPDIDDNPLCNGKTLYQQAPLTMPTIIRPKTSPTHTANNITNNYNSASKLKEQNNIYSITSTSSSLSSSTTKINQKLYNNYDIEEDETLPPSPPSPPMPNCPPPPPPAEFFTTNVLNALNSLDIDNETSESYGIALYNFDGQQDDDLSFRENEKIYLIKKLDDEWMIGRDRRGCEGMFPINFIDIKVPLRDEIEINNKKILVNPPTQQQQYIEPKGIKVRASFYFPAEAPEDLELHENDEITVLYEINSEWLYGRNGIKQGQFPSNFIEFIPINLPKMPSNYQH